MSVSDSVSDSSVKQRNSRQKSMYGDGSIWEETLSNGNKVWKVEVVIGTNSNGKTQKTRRTAKSRSEAVKLRRELNALKSQRTLTLKTTQMFGDFALDWVRTFKALTIKAATAADYEYRVRQYINPYIGNRLLEEITPHDIQRWATSLLDAGLSSKTVNGARRILYGIFRHAERQGMITHNPVESTTSLRPREGERTTLRAPWSREEALAALEAARKSPEMDLFIHLALYCGLRHGEILGMTWDSVDLAAATISVRTSLRSYIQFTTEDVPVRVVKLTSPKTAGSIRSFTIGQELAIAFERHYKWQYSRRSANYKIWNESSLVFATSNGTPTSMTNNTRTFKKFLRRNGLRDIRVHDLRHTAAVLALEAGASLEWVSQAFGHTSMEITKSVYAPYVQELNDRFTATLGAYLSQQAPLSSSQQQPCQVSHLPGAIRSGQ
jgi:integrase